MTSLPHSRTMQSGVFVVESQETAIDVARRAEADGLAVARLEGKNVSTKEAFLDEAARSLRFPEYVGRNWDAFEEALQDLEWRPARGYLLVIDRFDRLAAAKPREWAIALDILGETVDAWERSGTPMVVLLRGPKSAAPTVPELQTWEPFRKRPGTRAISKG
jgi:hypothetical protein